MVEETHFGFSRVPLHDKQARVDDVFHKVASRYDLMNDLMSGGLHRVWKDIFTARIRPSKRARFRHLDVAGGTGDIAFRVAEAGSASTEVVVLDINAGHAGGGTAARRQAAFRRGRSTLSRPTPRTCPSPRIVSTAIRSLSASATCRASIQALAEAHRVLRRGGKFLCLEFSHVNVPVLDRLYEAYSFRCIPLIGRLVAGDAGALSLPRRIDRALSGRREFS